MRRRRFLGATASFTLAFTLGFGATARDAEAAPGDTAVNAWLTIGTDANDFVVRAQAGISAITPGSVATASTVSPT